MKQKTTDIIGIGTDIISIKRLRENPSLKRIADFLLSTKEKRDMKESRDVVQFVASRWAAKEAVIKAYPATLTFKDIEIGKSDTKPNVHFKRQKDKDIVAFLSIAHDFDYALAYAILSVRKNHE